MRHKKYTKEKLQEAVNESKSMAEVLRFFGLRQCGGNYAYLNRRLKAENIDKSHFNKYTHYLKLGSEASLKKWEDILVLRNMGNRTNLSTLVRAMIESGMEYKCKCGLSKEWQGEKIVLEVHHTNGDWLDNRRNNVEFLCPNCHSQIHLRSRGSIERESSTLSSNTIKCIKCDNKVFSLGSRCKSCAAKLQKTKIKWMSTNELKKMVKSSSFSAVAKMLGVSDNAVRKRINNHSDE